MAEVTLTKENFEQEIMQYSGKCLVDFWAPWCGPCMMVAPVVEEVAHELEGKVKVGKVNIDEQPELAVRFGVMSIPTLLVVENGEVKETAVGARPKADILNLLGE